MAIGTALLSILLAQAPVQASEQVDVAHEELETNRNAAAIKRIESNEALDEQDPARLINLGIAHAREGRAADARDLFEAAMLSEQRFQLETVAGEWVDSKVLARQALAKLDRGELGATSRTAMR